MSKYPGIPKYLRYFPGSSQDMLISPRPSIPGFPSISGTSPDYPRIVLISPPPLPSIPGFPGISGTSQDGERNFCNIAIVYVSHLCCLGGLIPYPRIVLISPPPPLPVQVSWDSLVPQVLPEIIPGLYSSLPLPPPPPVQVSQVLPGIILGGVPLSKYPGIPKYLRAHLKISPPLFKYPEIP